MQGEQTASQETHSKHSSYSRNQIHASSCTVARC